MRDFILVVFAFLCLSSCSATAQSSPAQLCVANMQSVNAGTDTTGRDLLIKFLAKAKDRSVAQDVPIDASEPEQALQQAKSKSCDYLITTHQTENHQENSQMQGMGTFGQTSMPTYYVTTTYKLVKVSDGSDVASGNYKASDRGSEQNALGFTMRKIADKVTEAIKKAGPTSK
jgi:hypothetical protein